MPGDDADGEVEPLVDQPCRGGPLDQLDVDGGMVGAEGRQAGPLTPDDVVGIAGQYGVRFG